MNIPSDPVALAEQQVAEARTAVLAQYDLARANLKRRASSPVFIGGVMLGAAVLGYFATRRGKVKRPIRSGGTDALSLALNTARVLLPLLMAVGAATRSARRPAAGAVAAEE